MRLTNPAQEGFGIKVPDTRVNWECMKRILASQGTEKGMGEG
jgi:hypothetical protein